MNKTTTTKKKTARKKRIHHKAGCLTTGPKNRNGQHPQVFLCPDCEAHHQPWSVARYEDGTWACEVCHMRSLVLEMAGALRVQASQFTDDEISSGAMIDCHQDPTHIKKMRALTQRSIELFGLDAVKKSAIRFTEGGAA